MRPQISAICAGKAKERKIDLDTTNRDGCPFRQGSTASTSSNIAFRQFRCLKGERFVDSSRAKGHEKNIAEDITRSTDDFFERHHLALDSNAGFICFYPE